MEISVNIKNNFDNYKCSSSNISGFSDAKPFFPSNFEKNELSNNWY
jgi:hypothetical protein